MEAFVFRSTAGGGVMGSNANGRPHILGVERNGCPLSAETVVIGAGQAGLAASRELLVRGVDHVVLERGRVGETWRSQRWESFVLNTPVWMIKANGGTYLVDTSAGCYRSRSVVVAAGAQRTPRIPAIARALPPVVEQLHAASYCAPDRLPPGAVLIVGSGQTGCQITEELLEAGRRVYLATSRVGRLPRRYRGRDVLDWRCEMGFYEQTPTEYETYESLRAPIPITSGVRGGHTISLQQFARDGATLLGRLQGAVGTHLHFASDLSDNLQFGDEFAAEVRRSIDAYIHRQHINAPPAEADPIEAPHPHLGCDSPHEVDLRAAGIGTILWATGFGGDFSWLPSSLLDRKGGPAHTHGIGRRPGLYAIGLPWLSKRKSGIVYGVAEDTGRIARHIATRARRSSKALRGS